MAKSTHIKVLLVRAGMSAWDEAGRLSGSADLPLSEAGMLGVAAQASGIGRGELCQVLCGPEETAQATAIAIGDAAGAKVKTLAGLHELGVGLWEGLDDATAEERAGRAFRQWRQDPGSVVPPGGESAAAAEARLAATIGGALARCRADDSCGVCLVLRPLVLRLARAWLTGDDGAGGALDDDGSGGWLVVDRESVRERRAGRSGVVRHAG